MRTARAWHFGRTPHRALQRCSSRQFRRGLSLGGAFEEGDNVILSSSASKEGRLVCLNPLKVFQTGRGAVKHSDMIGKRPREVVYSSGNDPVKWRLFEPTLEEYVRMTARLSTPIYGADANLITTLLELHPSPPDPSTRSQIPSTAFEILEAGTGHGSLTLYLARSIHAANHPLSQPLQEVPEDDENSNLNDEYRSWRASRNAIIHSVENNVARSKHARRVVRKFRRGMYGHHVDFHCGDVADYLKCESRFAHIIFDLPAPEKYMEQASRSLRTGGSLMAWVPSITQAVDCVRKVQSLSLPLAIDTTLEMGQGISTGRRWDVRLARVRAFAKERERKEQEAKAVLDHSNNMPEALPLPDPDTSDLGSSQPVIGTEQADPDVFEADSSAAGLKADDEEIKAVCRPKVGVSIIGGGFLCVFKKKQEVI